VELRSHIAQVAVLGIDLREIDGMPFAPFEEAHASMLAQFRILRADIGVR
jgi:hypothetical protein